ncbi:MAG: VWA domain-containing protein [Terriglobales bacterium]|jgi:VWFA-related protein
MKSVRLLAWMLFMGQVSAAWGQTAAVPAGNNSGDRQVALDVVVTDKAGNSVPGLQQSDFTVLDDKQPQAILSFHATDESSKADDSPQQVIFVIDEVNATARAVSSARQQLEKFLRRGDGQLFVPMSLVFFADKGTQVLGAATRVGNSLADSLKSHESGLRDIGRSAGFYGAVERVQSSLGTLEKLTAYEAKQPGRKLLIWLSPGWPLISGPRSALSEKDQDTIFHTIVRLSTHLREARVTLYSIDPLGMDDAASFQTFYYENFLKGVPSANKVESGDVALQVIATQSGGQVLSKSNDVAGLIAGCVADAKAYYTLSFAAAAADHPNEYHNLQIKIDRPGLTARTRTGYYAQRQEVAK